MQIGFYFDQTRCTGCYTCVIACKDWHDVPAGPASWIRITSKEKGKFPDLSMSYLFNTCLHCDTPACVASCPLDVITKREEDGIVVVDREGCDACGNCLDACPYDAPQFGAEADATMQKCDLCLERWGQKKKPICVEACPMRALDAGPLQELKKKYGHTGVAEGFDNNERLAPSIVFKKKN